MQPDDPLVTVQFSSNHARHVAEFGDIHFNSNTSDPTELFELMSPLANTSPSTRVNLYHEDTDEDSESVVSKSSVEDRISSDRWYLDLKSVNSSDKSGRRVSRVYAKDAVYVHWRAGTASTGAGGGENQTKKKKPTSIRFSYIWVLVPTEQLVYHRARDVVPLNARLSTEYIDCRTHITMALKEDNTDADAELSYRDKLLVDALSDLSGYVERAVLGNSFRVETDVPVTVSIQDEFLLYYQGEEDDDPVRVEIVAPAGAFVTLGSAGVWDDLLRDDDEEGEDNQDDDDDSEQVRVVVGTPFSLEVGPPAEIVTPLSSSLQSLAVASAASMIRAGIIRGIQPIGASASIVRPFVKLFSKFSKSASKKAGKIKKSKAVKGAKKAGTKAKKKAGKAKKSAGKKAKKITDSSGGKFIKDVGKGAAEAATIAVVTSAATEALTAVTGGGGAAAAATEEEPEEEEEEEVEADEDEETVDEEEEEEEQDQDEDKEEDEKKEETNAKPSATTT